jgi:hypothetical protein
MLHHPMDTSLPGCGHVGAGKGLIPKTAGWYIQVSRQHPDVLFWVDFFYFFPLYVSFLSGHYHKAECQEAVEQKEGPYKTDSRTKN